MDRRRSEPGYFRRSIEDAYCSEPSTRNVRDSVDFHPDVVDFLLRGPKRSTPSLSMPSNEMMMNRCCRWIPPVASAIVPYWRPKTKGPVLFGASEARKFR